MKRLNADGTVERTVIIRRHLCVPEGLRLVSASAAAASPPVGVDADYLRRLSNAVNIIRNDQFFSAKMISALPADDLYAWPSVTKGLADAVAVRVRWLENAGAKALADQLRKAMGLLVSEVTLCGMISLDDTSKSVMGDEVVCKRFRAEAAGGQGAAVSIGSSPAVPLSPLGGEASLCASMWAIPHRYARPLVGREDAAGLVRTLSKATSDAVKAAFLSGGYLQAEPCASSFTPLAHVLPSVVVPSQLQQCFPLMGGIVMARLLSQAAAGGKRWYLRTGVALSLVEVPTVLLVERSAVVTLLGTHALYKNQSSPLNGSENPLCWGDAVASGRVVPFESSKQQGNSVVDFGKMVLQMGVLSKFPGASVGAVEDGVAMVLAQGMAPIKVSRVSMVNNVFLVLHGHGVSDSIPLPEGIMGMLESAANQEGQWF